MTTCPIVPMTAITLSNEGGVLRDYTRPEGARPDHYLDAYDRHTLIYDCVWLTDAGHYVITAPPMLNLWDDFRENLRKDGQSVSGVKFRKLKRTDQIVVPGPKGRLSTRIGTKEYEIVAREGMRHAFAGLNSIVALNKNNRLDWIRDWLNFYVARHGAEAVVLVDNGSSAYSLDELAATVEAVQGLKSAVIYSAPFPYGPLIGKTRRSERGSKFFQGSMLNAVRRDALSHARAVLSVDVDEIVDGPDGETIFDAAVKNPFGMITFKGYWAYPESVESIPATHAEHVYRRHENRKCNRKWCLAPNGLIGRISPWDVHQVGGILQNLFTEQTRFIHNHCYGCSTGWKKKRFDSFPQDLERDERLVSLMQQHFPQSSEN